MAEGAFRAAALRRGLECRVDSAGTASYHIGHPPDPRAIAVASLNGIDIAAQAARQIALEFGGALRLSALYRTPCFPVGAGPDYVNAAALVTLPRPVAADQALQTLHQMRLIF